MKKTSEKTARFAAIALITLLFALLFPPLGNSFWQFYWTLGKSWRLVIDLAQVTLFASLFTAIIAPLQTLGWWAGWYGEEVEKTDNPQIFNHPKSDRNSITRYVIYLDGINPAGFNYLPDIEQFLDQLAASLPKNVVFIREIIPDSNINHRRTFERPLSFLWRFADFIQASRYQVWAGILTRIIVNIRNLLIVCVSVDRRYGQIYNQGIAQLIYNCLINYGYQPNSGVPITLVGFSGGGQISMGVVPFLKQALSAPIDVISLAGLMGGNTNALKLEHLYHFVGEKDLIERLGAIIFPKRWPILFLSYWNRAKRKGKITIFSLGPVVHSGHGSAFDDGKLLPDGRSYLRQTLDIVTGIIKGISPLVPATTKRKVSNYELYQQGFFNHPSYYPLNQLVDSEIYCEIAPWMGRLILPKLEQRQQVKGVFFEVYHAPKDYEFLVGEVVNLRWSNDPQVQGYVRSVTKDLHFSDEALYSQSQGNIHPERLNHWQQVDPLESLAGSRPNDDQIVMLREPVTVAIANNPDTISRLIIVSEPAQITGRFYGLVKILHPVEDEKDRFLAVHFNRNSRLFDGVEEIICIPQVIANFEGIFSSTNKEIENSPVNGEGWYIYGAKNVAGTFVVQAIAPRSLLRLQPEEVIFGLSEAKKYVKKHCWQDILNQKGKTKSVLLCPEKQDIQEVITKWEEGDRALLLHVYGGIGGKKAESAARSPIFFGHFAYGAAKIVRDRLTQELIFDIEYYQVYTQNTDALIAGTQHWSRYMGDRQFGWLGTRPIADILIKLDALTEDYDVRGLKRSAMDVLIDRLEAMEARYRIGDGTGGTYVGPAHNCSQDSNQAVYTAIKQIEIAVNSYPHLQEWLQENPSQAVRFHQLINLGKSIKNKLLPFGAARADWINSENTLGISPEEDAFTGILIGFKSWRTLFPRLASETIALILIQQGASAWVLRTNQVGGNDSDIEPIAPTPIG
ncbi:CAAX protease [Oscillatoriales cyanobacterium USR001]|nr:CAAX protease [Oscillatoriales cyanobacterium USR001]